MKKLTVLLTLLVLTTVMFGQDVWQFKATKYCYEEDVDAKWSKWKDCDLVITFDTEMNIIKINNGYDDRFILSGDGEYKDGQKDSEGDVFSQVVTTAIDRDGARCTIKMLLWGELNCTHFYIYYDNCKYVYQCKLI